MKNDDNYQKFKEGDALSEEGKKLSEKRRTELTYQHYKAA